jgi:hypothetical protein
MLNRSDKILHRPSARGRFFFRDFLVLKPVIMLSNEFLEMKFDLL